MPEVTDWLAKLALGQYARRFAENDIDFSILSELTTPAKARLRPLAPVLRQFTESFDSLDLSEAKYCSKDGRMSTARPHH